MATAHNDDKLRWQRIKQLFEAALELSEDQRHSWLRDQCGDDDELLSQILTLLQNDKERSAFLKPPLAAGQKPLHLDGGSTRPGHQIGAYTLNRVIASGGMGTVYEATQRQPRRTVAVKLMRAGITSGSALRRFEYESELLARLRHNGIAQVYDAGTHRDGDVTVPYFAMEYIVGARPITAFARERSYGIRQRMALFVDVCDAVHHGHQKGIIHRDLKPSNILVDSSGQVKVIDFGVARSTDSDIAITTLRTELGQLIGTLQYMSPEQCAADPHDIDMRSDVYALGVVFYELLCERLPYEISSVSILEATRIIREQDPAKLSTLSKSLRGDVETIAIKAMEKDRERRYQSASALSADIRCYLNSEAISARPPSVFYQLQVIARRNKGVFTAMTAVFIALVSGAIVSTTLYFKADAARNEAVAARAESQTRANELQMVIEFQQSMLGGIDAEKMGRGIIEELRRGLQDSETHAPQEVESSVASFDRLMGTVNATNLALNVVDENVLARAVETIQEEFAEQPLVRAALQQTVADTYREIGLFDRAMPLQQSSLQTRREMLGDGHLDTLRSINNLGILYREMGKYDEAHAFVREAMDRSRRVLGDDHSETLNSMSNLAHILMELSRYDEALQYVREALEGERRVLGDDHPRTLRSLNDLGVYLRAMGKYEQAEPYLRDALDRKRRVLGDDHAETLIGIDNVGHVLKDLRRFEEALTYLREALKRKRRILGDDHPSTLLSINNMGGLLMDMEKYEEALPYHQESLERDRRVLGDEHPSTAISTHNMGQLLRELGRLAEAESHGSEAVRRARRMLPAGHSYTGIFLEAYGRTLLKLRRFADAEKALLESHATLKAALGNEHRRTQKTAKTLVALYESWDAEVPGKGYDGKGAAWRAKLPTPGKAETP